MRTHILRYSCLLQINYYAIVKEHVRLRLVDSVRVSTQQLYALSQIGGGERVRTDDPLRARQVLSQLSYAPDITLVGQGGLEPPTSRLSVVCSSQLSY